MNARNKPNCTGMSKIKGKTVNQSIVIMSQSMSFQDANQSGNVHGGVIMKLIDTAGGVVAMRHARCNVVTASIDRLDFYDPVYVGDYVTLKASINYVGRTSMEVGVRVESENLMTGKIRHTSSAYLTYVGLDKERRPMPLPPLILKTAEDKRRNREAGIRREVRLAEKKSEKKSQDKG